MSIPQFYLGSVNVTNWHQLGVFTVWNPDGATEPPFCCNVNGRFSIFWPMCGNARDPRDKGFVLVSFDEDGSICVYQSPDYAQYGSSGIQTSWSNSLGQNVFQSGNTFQWLGNKGTYQVQIPNAYQGGKTFVVAPINFSIPLPPCGQGTYDSTTFINQGGFIAYEYSKAFGQNNNFYVTIMRNNTIVGAGFLGNYPGNQDPFSRYAISLPSVVVVSNLRYKNGAFTYCSFGSSGLKYVGATTLRLNGDYTQLNCGSAANVYADASSQFNTDVGALTGNANHYAGTANGYQMTCDIPLTYATTTFTSDGLYSSFSLYNQFQLLDLRLVLTNSQALFPNGCVGVNVGTNRVYAGFRSDANNSTITVWSAPIPSIAFPPSKFSIEQHDGLYNYHRAVSPTGNFQA